MTYLSLILVMYSLLEIALFLMIIRYTPDKKQLFIKLCLFIIIFI